MQNYARRVSVVFVGLWMLMGLLAPVYSQETNNEPAEPFTRMFDTVIPLPAGPLSDQALAKKDGWLSPAEDVTSYQFTGDVVFLNDKLVVALRQGAAGAELYSRGDGLKLQAQLIPLGDHQKSALKFAAARIVQNNPAAVTLEADYLAADDTKYKLNYELGMGQVFVQTTPAAGITALDLQAPARFVVLPDFFADDIVMDAVEQQSSPLELPSENFILHLMPGGQSIVMAVWDVPAEDVQVYMSGPGEQKQVDASRITYGPKGKIWAAVMEDRDIWHSRQVSKDDNDKVIPLGWKAPYPALWRVDWRRDNGLNDSWEMISQRPDGAYTKHTWFGVPEQFIPPPDSKTRRERWTTVLGWFNYPCWLDLEGNGFIQPLKKHIQFAGPLLIYPINRIETTPIDKFTVVDVVRGTLGVGPCEYILDVQGQQKKHRGAATCATGKILADIYAAKEQRARRQEVSKALDNVQIFVRDIRSRIEEYTQFGHDLLQYLAQQKEAHPDLAEQIAQIEAWTRVIDENRAPREEKIQKPQVALDLIEDFRRNLVDYEGDDALERCKSITDALIKIGGNQDELVGESRLAVKILRQRAAMMNSDNPDMQQIISQVRRRTMEILKHPRAYEAPRH